MKLRHNAQNTAEIRVRHIVDALIKEGYTAGVFEAKKEEKKKENG